MTTRRRAWKIIDNDAQEVLEFHTRREWREAARQMRGDGHTLRRSPTDDRTLYTPTSTWVPGPNH